MSGSKALFGCIFVACCAGYGFLEEAQSADGGNSAKSAAKAEDPLAEKPSAATGPTAAAEQSANDKFCQCVGRGQSAAAKKIGQVLDGPLRQTGLDYTDQPLQDVVAQLGDDYGIPIQLDKVALDDAGIGSDVPITVSIHNISLRSGLKLMFRSLDLTWMVRDEALIVTTRQGAEKDLDTCVYNVQGLVDDTDPKSVDALIDAIVSVVRTDTWAENGGGEAEVRALPSGLLVVAQTQAIQEEVGALLNTIRKMRETVPLTKVGPRGYEGTHFSRRSSGRSRSSEQAPTQQKPPGNK